MILIPILMIFVGVYFMYWGGKTISKLNKYEFENTSEQGVVEFESHEAKQRHEAQKNGSPMVIGIGFFGFLIGVVWFLGAAGAFQV